MTHSERGSATLHVVFAAVILCTAFAAAFLGLAISIARHKLTAAADLTALSAAQSLASQSPETESGPTSCAVAARTAALNKVELSACEVASTAVTVQVSRRLDLRVARPTLTSTARAGPL